MSALPLNRLLSATALGLALLILPTLSNSALTQAQASTTARFDDDDHRGDRDGKKYSKKYKRDRDDDDDDDKRRRYRNRRFNNDSWWYRQNRRSHRWPRAHYRYHRY